MKELDNIWYRLYKGTQSTSYRDKRGLPVALYLGSMIALNIIVLCIAFIKLFNLSYISSILDKTFIYFYSTLTIVCIITVYFRYNKKKGERRLKVIKEHIGETKKQRVWGVVKTILYIVFTILSTYVLL